MNGVSAQLVQLWGISSSGIGTLTSSVQLGFIGGTLFISLTGLADRFHASRIFVCCSIFGALFNVAFAWFVESFWIANLIRFCVGMCLAGIYPLGMKLIVGWAPERTGTALAQLVGMLTLGTALPHGLQAVGANLSWRLVITASSMFAIVGGILVYALGDGPYLSTKENKQRSIKSIQFGAVIQAFQIPNFRAAALGYFGHMWELYAFWTIVPFYINHLLSKHSIAAEHMSALAFLVIGSGAIGCIIGGAISHKYGSAKVAFAALTLSGLCSILFVTGFDHLSMEAALSILILWGCTVVADSPHFSAISAASCPRDLLGSALAIQNAIGFSITIISIALITSLFNKFGINSAWILFPGPAIGLIFFFPALRRLKR